MLAFDEIRESCFVGVIKGAFLFYQGLLAAREDDGICGSSGRLVKWGMSTLWREGFLNAVGDGDGQEESQGLLASEGWF